MAKKSTKTESRDPIPTTGRVIGVSIATQMQKSYLDYAMSVIVARALPDVRDGLKPVQRRIIYAMQKQGMTHSSSYKKCAAVVGEVMKEFHPHGDLAIYNTLVRMAQDFSLRNPLIDGQGNFGSVDGDSPAAMRYTECRLAPISAEMLKEIAQATVDFMPNYSGETEEPTVLPTLFPNLLVNGSAGIAVGMATNIPPHNLGELVNALIVLVDKGQAISPGDGDLKPDFGSKVAPEISFQSDATIEELLHHIPGPDFPTAGEVYDVKEIMHTYTTGKGNIVTRGVAQIEEIKNGKTQITITELPYQVNKASLVEKIADLVKKDKLKGIADLRDESDRRGMSVVVELKRDVRPQKILNYLYKHTDLQKTFNANMVALVHGEPKLLTLKQILEEFVKHRQLVIIRRTLFLLAKAREREHILEGLQIALDHLDEVIETIKKSKDAEIAKTNLMERFGLSEIQAQAILDMQLRKLAALEQQKIRDELAEIKKRIAEYESLLHSPQAVLATIKKELLELKGKFEEPRRTKIFKRGLKELTTEDLIADEEVLITLTESGYIKRLNAQTYKSQARGGKGIKGMKTKDEDAVSRILFANTHDQLLFFTNKGKVYSLFAHEIPEASRMAKGTALVNLVDMSASEKPQSIVKLQKNTEAQYLVFVTKGGQVKRTALSEFTSIRKSGKIAIHLSGEDELSWTQATSGQDEIMLATAAGMSIRFKEDDIRPMGRTAGGVRGISLKRQGDRVVGMAVVEEDSYFLTASEKGYGKITKMEDYNLQKRGGSGTMTAKITDRTGPLVSARLVTNVDSDLLMTSANGQVVRIPLKKVSVLGRATQGVRLIKLGNDDGLAAVAVLSKQEEETEVPTAQEETETESLDAATVEG